jgi:hypothetical protein
MKIPLASKLRKDQLEAVIKDLLFAQEAKVAIPATPKQGSRDVDRGLRLDLPIVHYISNKETKLFIEREAAKIQPGFTRAAGTRYLLNRWREEQIAAGCRITYRDLVLQAVALNKSKRGPLRIEHGRYMKFVSDYMADNQGAVSEVAVRIVGSPDKVQEASAFVHSEAFAELPVISLSSSSAGLNRKPAGSTAKRSVAGSLVSCAWRSPPRGPSRNANA